MWRLQKTERNYYPWYLLTIYYKPDPRCDFIMHRRWFHLISNNLLILLLFQDQHEKVQTLLVERGSSQSSCSTLSFCSWSLDAFSSSAVPYLSEWSILALHPYFGVFQWYRFVWTLFPSVGNSGCNFHLGPPFQSPFILLSKKRMWKPHPCT